MPNAEVELIMRAFAENLQTYEQVIEARFLPVIHFHVLTIFIMAALGIPGAIGWWASPAQFRALSPTGDRSATDCGYLQPTTHISGKSISGFFCTSTAKVPCRLAYFFYRPLITFNGTHMCAKLMRANHGCTKMHNI